MTVPTTILLSSTSHAGDSTESTVVGEAYKGAGFYGIGFGNHTTSYQVNEFVGTIKIQASLSTTPTEADWFDVDGTEYTHTGEPTSTVKTLNFIGNFVWLRATVVFYSGTVTKVLVNY